MQLKTLMGLGRKIGWFFTILVLTSFAFLCDGCLQGNQIYPKVYPGTCWEEKVPESLGVNPIALNNALSYFDKHSGGVGSDEMIIIRYGYIIWKGPAIDKKHELFSCTKIFTSTVLGIMVKDRKIKVDDLAVNYFPELDHGDDGQEVYNQIRIGNLATMTSGYRSIVTDCWDLHLKGQFIESYDCTQKFTIPGIPESTPGTVWQYNDQGVHLLGYILTKVANQSLEEVFKDRIADKIGMSDWDWSDYGFRDGMFFNNPAGTPNNDTASRMNEVQCGIWTTAREFARLGLLYLNRGKWGDFQLLDTTYVDRAISNQVPVSLPFKNFDLTGRYGYYWWTNGIRKDGTRPWPSAPIGTAAAHGGSRNFCFIIPEWEMVIVRMSPRWEDPIPAHGDPVWEGFFNRLKNGVDTDIK
jgi:CubicO group peptidase (beta-lactamase class C family)